MSALRRMRATDTPIAFKPWVYEIAKNACIDAFRRSSAPRRSPTTPTMAASALQPREQQPDARRRGRHAHVARPPARRLRRAVGGPPPDPRHARARGPELPPDRRAPRHEPPVGGVDAVPRAPPPRRGVRGARLRRALPAHPGDHRRRRPAAARAPATSASIARHVSYCQPCRRAALRRASIAALAPKRSVREKIAALLPLPASSSAASRRGGDERRDVDRRPWGAAGPAVHGRGQLRRAGERLGQGRGRRGHRRRRRRRGRCRGPRHRLARRTARRAAAPVVARRRPRPRGALTTRAAANATRPARQLGDARRVQPPVAGPGSGVGWFGLGCGSPPRLAGEQPRDGGGVQRPLERPTTR